MTLIHKPVNDRVFRRYLQLGENIKWVGRPGLRKRESRLPSKDMIKGLFWLIVGITMAIFILPDIKQHCGFRLFLYSTLGFGSKSQWARQERDIGIAYQFFFIVALAFCLYGLAVIFIHFMLALPIQPTRYAITDRRVLLIRGVPSSKFAEYDLSAIAPEITKESPDGSGTITLKGPEIDIGDFFKSLPDDILKEMPQLNSDEVYSAKMSPGLVNIPDVRKVHDLILQLKNGT